MKREFFSTNEVAELLGITPFTIRRYIQLRKLKAVKLMGSYRVRQTDLEQFLKAREIETEDELAAQTSETPQTNTPRVKTKSAARRVPKAKPKSKPRAVQRQREEA